MDSSMKKTIKECAEAILNIVKAEPEMANGVIRAYLKQIGELARMILQNAGEPLDPPKRATLRRHGHDRPR